MSVQVVVEWSADSGMTPDKYWGITDQLDARERLPDGCEHHSAAGGDGQPFIVSEVWRDGETFHDFGGSKLGPASQAAGAPQPDKVTVVPLIRQLS